MWCFKIFFALKISHWSIFELCNALRLLISETDSDPCLGVVSLFYLFSFIFFFSGSLPATHSALFSDQNGATIRVKSVWPQTTLVNHSTSELPAYRLFSEADRNVPLAPKTWLRFPQLLLVAVKEVIDGLCTAPAWLHQSGVITPVCGIQIKSVHSGYFADPVGRKPLKNKQV